MPRTEKEQRPLRELDTGARRTGWRSRGWPHLIVLAVIGIFGIWFIARFGQPNFGDPERCEGIGFGCAPSQFGDTVSVILAFVVCLVVTGFARRFLPKRLAWQVTAGGLALTILITGIAWAGAVVRYGVPGASLEEGRNEARRILSAMRTAVGEATPFSTELNERVRLGSVPSPAAVIAAIREGPASPCTDVNDHDTGTSHFGWRAHAEAIIPATIVHGADGLGFDAPAEHVALINRVGEALARLGYTISPQNDGHLRWAVNARNDAPKLEREGYLPDANYSGGVELALLSATNPDEITVVLNAHVSTPCLRRGM